MCKELESTTDDGFTWSSLPYAMETKGTVRHPRLMTIRSQATGMKRSSSAEHTRRFEVPECLIEGKTARSSSLTSLATLSSDDVKKDINCQDCGGKKLEDSRILKGHNIQAFYAVWKIKDTGKKLVNNHRFDLPSALTRNDSYRTCGCMTRTHQKNADDNKNGQRKYCKCLEMNVT